MAVSITKKFWNSTDVQWDDIAKVVFTSPNIDSPAAAGSRSHILPGSPYIGTWYEAVDFMHRIRRNQDATDINGNYFHELYLGQDTFDFTTDTTVSGLAPYQVTFSGSNYIYHDRTNYGIVASGTTYDGTTSISGVTYYKYTIPLDSTTGTSTISGSSTTVSGSDKLYINWTTSNIWATSTNSIVFEVTLGEAYNCRLTAWDDNTHTTTTNKILSEGHYKATCLAYKSCGGTKQAPAFVTTSGTYIADLMVHPPETDKVLQGNTSYYGDFDLIHVADGGVSGLEAGEYLLFHPRLDDMNDSFTSGNYDFVTTLHYQYT